jgi:ABC-type nitrate/sulfonate/bicarbonate transport system ATPase subunit
MSAPALQFRSVSKSFATRRGEPFEVLRAVSFEVAPSSVTAVLGPSGCGKSTLLHLAAGLAKPDQGQILLFGQPIGTATDWRRVAYMFQDNRLLPWRTALGNVELALEPLKIGHAERRERAIQALERVGLADFADSFPHQLSGGMRSRIALARSLVSRPALLLMDEPFTGLDGDTKGLLHDMFLALRRETGMAAVLVTHDEAEAGRLSQHLVRLSECPAQVLQPPLQVVG